jgi:hypothetical protein
MLASYGGARHSGTRPLARPVFAAPCPGWAWLSRSPAIDGGNKRGVTTHADQPFGLAISPRMSLNSAGP